MDLRYKHANINRDDIPHINRVFYTICKDILDIPENFIKRHMRHLDEYVYDIHFEDTYYKMDFNTRELRISKSEVLFEMGESFVETQESIWYLRFFYFKDELPVSIDFLTKDEYFGPKEEDYVCETD